MSLEDVMSKTAKPKTQATPAKMGRPPIYSEQIANELLQRIASGESLNKISKDKGMPSHTVVYEWLAQKPDFAEKYARAREDQAETLADEIQAIADEEPPTVPTKFGEQIDTGWLMWQKQRVDARKWTASKLKPRKYGDRLTHAGDADNPVAVQADISIFDAMLKNLETKRQLGDK
jgi:hypothetical protein